MKKRCISALNPRACLLFIFFATCISAQAQKTIQPENLLGSDKPIVVHNKDTTYVWTNNTLGEVSVMAKRYDIKTSLNDVINSGKITTSVNGLTKDLQRDIPSTIRFYTPQGIPILTKYTSNNSLTPAIPDSAATLELREPSAKFPNPDAPIIFEPNYGRRGNLFVSPLTQTINAGTGTDQSIAANLSLSHSGPPSALSNQLPELNAYSTTFSGFGALQAKTSRSKTELIIHHSQSANEYSNLLSVENYYEDNHNTNISLSHTQSLGSATLDAGFITQDGLDFRNVTERSSNREIINEIQTSTYTMGLSNHTTELRANYTDYSRVYAWPADTVRQKRLESVVTHTQPITEYLDLTLESRFDFQDLEPSFSGTLDIEAGGNVSVNVNGGRLFDAVASEGLNNLMNSVQVSPHPWVITYGSVEANYTFNATTITTSLMHKTLKRGWYGLSADINGWVGRIGANGFLYWTGNNNTYLKWNYEGVTRTLSLDLPGYGLQKMPGPAKFEQHISLETGFGNMTYALRLDSYIDRHIRVDMGMAANLGNQHFLSFDASRRMGAIELGLKLYNLLALTGTNNYFSAHYSESNGVSYVSAPPFFDLSLRVDLF